MIFVALGTQDKPFTRLLEAIDKCITDGDIKDEVVVQAGYTKFESDNMKVFDYIPFDKFGDYINGADIIITHGGVGSIISAVKQGKRVMAVARLKEYGEHTNNHQLQVIKKLSEEGFIIDGSNLENIAENIEKTRELKTKEFNSNTENFIISLQKEIQKLFA